MPYWIPGSPFGFGYAGLGQGASAYGNFPSLDFSGAAGASIANTRYNFSNGWFIGSEGSGLGLSGFGASGFSQIGGLGNFGSLSYQGMQAGYNFQNSPITVYAGFDTLKYNTGMGSPFAPFDNTSGTLPGYSAHAGVEYRPTNNISLSLGVGFTQGPTASDLNAMVLPGASLTGRR